MDILVIRSAARNALLIAAFCLSLPQIAASQGPESKLDTLSLENLLSMEVTSVSRHQEELRKTPAAVYVITQEDIRRSGVTDVAELLRMVPGVQVAQINSNVWAVGARGFSAEYSNKLLVLVDGRTVYDPTFSGVYWRLQNLVLEDIDRIEVIRGPGATMWGANAVSGVINITTKKAANTQGGLLVADSGTGRPAEGSLRFGGSLGKTAFYRIFGTQTTRSSLSTPSGADGLDSWNTTNGGFRLDWSPSKTDSVSFESSAYRGLAGSNRSRLMSLSPLVFGTQGPTDNIGGHLLTRWSHSFKNASNLTMQAYYDTVQMTRYHSRVINTVDFDLQYSFKIGPRNNVMLGFGRRDYRENYHNDVDWGVTPSHEKIQLTSGFVQDEITVVKDKLYVIAGTKIEDNSFAGNNVQPSVRLAWLPTSRHSAWLSASRAVRSVNPVERGMYLNLSAFPAGSLLGLVSRRGQSNTRSEGVIAYEAGYRYQANRKLWFDLASFYNVYDHLSTTEAGTTFFEAQPGPAHFVLPLYFANGMRGETYGTEATAEYKLTPSLTLKGSYSLLRLALHAYDGHVFDPKSTEGQSPQNQGYIGASYSLPKSFTISANAYVVGGLPSFQIPAHTRLDLNLGWKGLENLEFNVVGQNLLGSHIEYGSVISPSNVINRSIFGKVTWRF